MPVAPAASCAKCRKHTSVVTTVAPGHPAFPHAMVSFVLSPAIGLSCHRRLRIDACPRPVGPTRHRRLDAGVEASGPHDFTVRASIARPRAPDRSQAKACPAITSARPTLPASTASHPNVRDDRDTPLVGDETATDMQVICVNMKSKYFCKWGWTGKSVNCPSRRGKNSLVLTAGRRRFSIFDPHWTGAEIFT